MWLPMGVYPQTKPTRYFYCRTKTSQIPVGADSSVYVVNSPARNVRLKPHGVSLPLRGRGPAIAGDEVLPLREG